MRVRANNIGELVEMLVGEMKMSQAELARYVGVEKYLVTLWKQGRVNASAENYAKVQEMVLKLNGRNVRYRGQALDILRGME